MNTQTKQFTVKLLNELISSGNFVNITNGNRDMNVVSRYHEDIAQEMLYAIEDNEGNFTILENNIINTLIFEQSHIENVMIARRLNQHILLICIAKVENDEEEKLFKHLVAKK